VAGLELPGGLARYGFPTHARLGAKRCETRRPVLAQTSVSRTRNGNDLHNRPTPRFCGDDPVQLQTCPALDVAGDQSYGNDCTECQVGHAGEWIVIV